MREGDYPPVYPTDRTVSVFTMMRESDTYARVGPLQSFRARRAEDGSWILECTYDRGGHETHWYNLGSYHGGAIGHYPNRHEAELALWKNISASLGVKLGFFGDGGG